MDRIVIGRITYNFSVVIIAVFLHYSVRGHLGARSATAKSIVLGVGLGFATSLSIFLSVPVWSGVILDSKMILGVLAGFYGGWVAGMVTAAIAAATRFLVGGIGALGGSLGVALCVVVGVAFRRRYFDASGGTRVWVLLAMGACSSVIQVVVAFTLLLFIGFQETIEVISTLILPTAIVYAPATLLIGLMFGFVDDRAAANAKLAEARARLQEANATLEERILGRTSELVAANGRLKSALSELSEAQDRLVLSEKLASLGQLVAGIAHELNTPLGAIASASRSQVALLRGRLFGAMRLYGALDERASAAFDELTLFALSGEAELSPSSRAERKAAAEALHGTALEAADDAIEIVGDYGLYGSRSALRSLARSTNGAEALKAVGVVAGIKRSSDIVAQAAEKAAMTVRALGSYSSSRSSEPARIVDPVEGVEAALAFLRDSLRLGVTITRDYDPGVSVRIDGDRFVQVWINLIRNALQAMSYAGTLGLSVKRDGGRVLIGVSDDGPGIPEGIRARVFEPFFTTKMPGEGVGLGLDICRMIVERSGGEIRFETGPRGTAFFVSLPEAAS